jgi:hypothetical protein
MSFRSGVRRSSQRASKPVEIIWIFYNIIMIAMSFIICM